MNEQILKKREGGERVSERGGWTGGGAKLSNSSVAINHLQDITGSGLHTFDDGGGALISTLKVWGRVGRAGALYTK